MQIQLHILKLLVLNNFHSVIALSHGCSQNMPHAERTIIYYPCSMCETCAALELSNVVE
jgi:hypothetical protein